MTPTGTNLDYLALLLDQVEAGVELRDEFVLELQARFTELLLNRLLDDLGEASAILEDALVYGRKGFIQFSDHDFLLEVYEWAETDDTIAKGIVDLIVKEYSAIEVAKWMKQLEAL